MTSVLYTPPFLFYTVTTSLFHFYLVLPTAVTNLFQNLLELFSPPLLPPLSFQTSFLAKDTPKPLPVEMQEEGLQCPGVDHCHDTADPFYAVAHAAHTVSSQIQLH